MCLFGRVCLFCEYDIDTPTTTPIPATVLPSETPGHFKVGVKAATARHEVQADEAAPSEDTTTAQPQKPVDETEPDADTPAE